MTSVSDPEYFGRPSASSSSSSALQVPDNWPLRFTSLKRLFRLITQYFVEVLHQPTSAVKSLDVPDLQKVARGGDRKETLVLCRLCIAIAVMSKHNAETIAGIQSLKEVHQQRLMEAIALVGRLSVEHSKIERISGHVHAGARSER